MTSVLVYPMSALASRLDSFYCFLETERRGA